ncbi:MAG TPA: hypothetical protein VG798_07935, partial [Rhizomicrobium sp.]|nr:hypothetical protein [Rhizomicrobium sp.]
IFWVRNVAVAEAAHNKKESAEAEKQVVANAHAIADAIGGFYGKPAGDKLFTLLAGHYGAIKAHLEATLKGDKKGQAEALKKAAANGEEIATFLSKANPYLPHDVLLNLLTGHVGHHAAQNEAIKEGDWEREASVWNAMRMHMLNISDALAAAIAKQFPDKI